MERLSQLAINDEGFIFDPYTGNSYATNRTGILILNELKNGKSEEEIAKILSEKFNVEHSAALKDVTDFIEQLRSLSLL
ncbi:PqqD family protein [Hippea sp. KM1]|uniref:PqqD family protein n=1 Tax=Hippea sp. KM1 TaxID=944481 RepID=UPI00046CBD4A|nr:PqqD family protein [Hippea sp. KM1]